MNDRVRVGKPSECVTGHLRQLSPIQSTHLNTVRSTILNFYVLDYFSYGIGYRQCAIKAGKEFPNLVVGEEGHVNNCRIL